jgi:hypothetical protein
MGFLCFSQTLMDNHKLVIISKKKKWKKIMEGQYYTNIRDTFSCFNTENEEKRLFYIQGEN